jgi:hypothetical protein
MALTDNLVHYWKFDELSGDAADSVGSLTLTNTNTVTYVSGLINNGANFVRVTDQKLATTTDIFGSTLTAYSINLWTKIVTAPTSGNLSRFAFQLDTPGFFVISYFNDAGTLKIRCETPTQDLRYTVTLSTVAYTMVTFTWDGTDIILYVNASNVATVGETTTDTTGTTGFCLGNQNNANTGLTGIMDEVGFWAQRAISSSEVTSLYNGGAGLAYPFTAVSTATVNRGLSLMGVGQ